MYVGLWSAENSTMYSDIFSIAPGKVCVLHATGLEKEKVRVTDTEFKTCQTVCVRRILHMAEGIVTPTSVFADWVVSGVNVSKIVDDVVQWNNSCWILSHANNLRIIGIPGTYRLELNDATAIGVAQVYAELYDANQLPSQVAHLFF